MFPTFMPNGGNDLILDTKRGIVVNVRNMTGQQDIIYNRNFFNSFRPDLSELERLIWVQKLDTGEKYLQAMRNRLTRETERVRNLYPHGSKRERIKPFYDQFIQLGLPFTQFYRASTNRDWEDASKLVNHVETKILKVKKYGIEASSKFLSQDKAKELEDQLTQRFLKEMRKPPKVKVSQQQED